MPCHRLQLEQQNLTAGEWGRVTDQERLDGHAEHVTDKASHNLAVASSWQDLSSEVFGKEINGFQEQFSAHFYWIGTGTSL